MKSTTQHELVISIHPSPRGFGFSVFDTPKNLLDWGYSDIRVNKKERTLKKLKVLIELYQPKVLVVEDTTDDSSRRTKRIKKLITAITTTALKYNVAVHHYSPEQMSSVFDSKNKDIRAKSITEVLPELAPLLPPKRRIWDSQHRQMQVFDAVALALTYFYLET